VSDGVVAEVVRKVLAGEFSSDGSQFTAQILAQLGKLEI
jgi:hypothetical protein